MSQKPKIMPLCKCGCGERLVWRNHYRYMGIPKYLKGHYQKTKEFHKTHIEFMKGNQYALGYKHTSEYKEKISGKNHPMKRPEVKAKHIEAMNKPETKARRSKIMKEITNTPEFKASHSGKNNGRWQGGISFLPYSPDWTETLRKSIRQRDNYTCQSCGLKWEKGQRRFTVHHIDYNKMNCEPKNLITLCNSCNSKVNKDRKHWTKYFKALMSLKGKELKTNGAVA